MSDQPDDPASVASAGAARPPRDRRKISMSLHGDAETWTGEMDSAGDPQPVAGTGRRVPQEIAELVARFREWARMSKRTADNLSSRELSCFHRGEAQAYGWCADELEAAVGSRLPPQEELDGRNRRDSDGGAGASADRLVNPNAEGQVGGSRLPGPPPQIEVRPVGGWNSVGPIHVAVWNALLDRGVTISNADVIVGAISHLLPLAGGSTRTPQEPKGGKR